MFPRASRAYDPGLNATSAQIPLECLSWGGGYLTQQQEDYPCFRTIHLGLNSLPGSIPPQLGALSNVQVVGLNNNRLSGE